MSSKSSPNSPEVGPSVYFLEVHNDQEGQRLDNFLFSRLKGVPKSRIYRIIRKGEVRVNKKRAKPDYKLKTSDLVRIPPIRISQAREKIPPSASLQALLEQAVLYQDEALMVVNKPAGLAVHGGTGVKIGLIEALRHMHPETNGLELVHRLDKGTSGCLLLALKAGVLKILASSFKAGKVDKTYHAIVQGEWPKELTIVNAALLKQPALSGERFIKVSADGKSALTRFAVLENYTGATLVEAYPVSGRTHQIRVHAQHAGHPVIGDEKYSPPEARKQFAAKGIKRLCLHAAELSLLHPLNGQALKITAPYDLQFTEAIAILQQAGD